MSAAPLAMFPLGTVLLPGIHLPLHVFEDRYRAMVRDCLAGEGRFGVVLIERGSEVGGGDVRFTTGTTATIVQSVELPDGRWLLEVVGTRRIRVIRWLPDDPYPFAHVEELWEPEPGPDAPRLLADVASRMRRTLALRAELGETVAPASSALDDDPAVAVYQAAALTELGPLDTQRVLDQPGTDERLMLVIALLDDALADLAKRMR